MRTSRKIAVFSSGGMAFSEADFTYTGTYTFEKAGKNWKIKFLTSGTFTPLKSVTVDVFVVGGGGGGSSGSSRRAGGGGGYTATAMSQALTENTGYIITVGDGGAVGQDGDPSNFDFTVIANGGKKAASYSTGGAGGSGGAGCSNSAGSVSAVGGSNGGNGETGESNNHGGAGQGTTTREFGEESGQLYGGGGGGMPGNWAGGDGGGGAGGSDGIANTGGGGGGQSGAGGSGIVIIRNAR